MSVLNAALTNLTTPAVIAFICGMVFTAFKSDLELPDQIAKGITIYLLLTIGIKGGKSLSETPLHEVARPGAVTLAIGIITPILAYVAFRRFGQFDVTNGAALAAHYGSVSLVTFAESLNFLSALGLQPEGYVSALLTLLEIPAIIVALVIAKSLGPDGGGTGIGGVLRHVLPEASVVLLITGLLVGWIGGAGGYEQIQSFFIDPFRGVLTLFLLQMGVIAARHLKEVRQAGFRLIALAIALPIINGVIGAVGGKLAGMSLAGATVMACMAASASYIAAPAAVGMALPKANPGYYLTAAIGVTFPFNVAIGIPLYYAVTQLLY